MAKKKKVHEKPRKPAKGKAKTASPPIKQKRKGAIPWAEIRSRYLNDKERPTYRGLAAEYEIHYQSIARRAKEESWQIERDKQYNKIVTAISQQAEEKQVYSVMQSLEKMKGMFADMEESIKQVDPKSKEGVWREMRETLKTMNSILGEPTERIEMSGEQRERLIAVFTRLKAVAPAEYEELKAIYGYESAIN